MPDRLQGFADPSFAMLRRSFAESFEVDGPQGEIGAALCVYRHGKPVVDLWGGYVDAARERPFEHDTLVLMMSVAKGICALVMHMLVDRNKLELNWPVARVWPEFARRGKGGVLIRQVLNHRAGIPGIDPKLLPVDYYDHSAVVVALERSAPMWPPGTTPCYHSVTMGYILGELVRRVDGRTLGTFVRDEIAGPLGAEYVIGTRPAELKRLAEWIEEPQPGSQSASGELSARVDGGLTTQADADPLGFFIAEIPSANGCGQVRGVARIYAALAADGQLDGVRLLRRETLARAVRVEWEGLREELTGGTDIRMASGFMLSSPISAMGPNRESFGHPGTGGAIGFADPANNLSFSYAPVAPYPSEQLGRRTPRLVDALYACL